MDCMRIKLLIVSISLGLVGLLPIRVLALDEPSFGGNNSSDYQPPTGNPQTNPATNLQPTNTLLQPVVTTLNQQSLVQSGGLLVLTAPDRGATSTAAEPLISKKQTSAVPTWIIGGLLTLAAIAYVIFKPDTQTKPSTLAAVPAKPKKVIATPKPKITKKPVKKTTRKKRKTTRS